MSLDFIYKELQLSLLKLQMFHKAILDVIASTPQLTKNFPKYSNRFTVWCSQVHECKLYKGKNYEQYKNKVKSWLEPEVVKREETNHHQILKKAKLESPPINIFSEDVGSHSIASLHQEIHKRNHNIIINLLSGLLQSQIGRPQNIPLLLNRLVMPLQLFAEVPK